MISREETHLSAVLVSAGYQFSFVKRVTTTKKRMPPKEPAPDNRSSVVLL